MSNPKCVIKNKKLDFHPPNNMIPKNFDIYPENPEFSKQPILIKQWDDTDLWYKKDDEFKMPKAMISMKIFTTDCEFGTTLKGRVFSNIWNSIAGECMREFHSACECANVQFSNFFTLDNIEFECSGYNDSMPNLISESIDCLL